MISKIVWIVLLVFLGACTTIPSHQERTTLSDQLASANGFQKSFIKTHSFTLTVYSRLKSVGQPIHIYIEGDGVSWISRTKSSNDPTPDQPLVLKLATLDTAENVAYLARPGQYAEENTPDCDPVYWSNKRFSEEVIESMNEAVSALASRAATKQIHLIGYSGGAAVAVLIAARRSDIMSIKTIAGNLNSKAVCQYHHVNPLEGSLDPFSVARKIKSIPQRHFVGSKDQIVPLFIAQSFVREEGARDDRQITVVPGVSHSSGWEKMWGQLQSGF